MNLTHLHYVLYALELLANNKLAENAVAQKAYSRLLEFLESDELEGGYRELINENIGVLYEAKRILKIYAEGGRCNDGIIELNYLDFKKLIDGINSI